MIAYVYRRKRRSPRGTIEMQRTYRCRYRLAGEFAVRDVPLKTTVKQAAYTRLMALVQEQEREKAGLQPAKSECEAMSKTTLSHLEDFLNDLKTLGRSPHYQRIMRARLTRLVAECGFTKLGSFSADGFVTWRSRQGELGPKALNEYLNYANAFLNWLKRPKRIAANPLATVTKVDVRGRQRGRRAITPEELTQLLAVAGDRRLLYLMAVYTGLRLRELGNWVWADLHLSEARPFLVARASTTKNRQQAVQPLHPTLASEPQSLPHSEGDAARPVFSVKIHPERNFKRNLAKAKIEPFDALGRKLDFHALRYTFATRLAKAGISQRLTQELMRHSDPAFTANIYTDTSQLPTFDAVASLAWERS